MDWDEWIYRAIIATIIAGVISLFYLMWRDFTGDKIYLLKDDWACTARRAETTYVMSGKVMVPVTTSHCVQYSLKD